VKKMLWLTVGVIAGLSLVSGGASAITLGNDITMPDESGSGSGWYGVQEDNEVEPNCVIGQPYDLEAFTFDDTSGNLSMIGGYDFLTGGVGPNTAQGDLFIDVDGDLQYGAAGHAPSNYNPYDVVSDTFGYDFVVDLNFAAGTYTVVDIRGATDLRIQTDGEQINDAANPWRYLRGGEVIVADGHIDVIQGLTDADLVAYGLTGGTHNAATVNLNWLAPYVEESDFEFWTHFTMECGNDNLMGHNPGIPEPATISLLGLGLLGAVMRKKFWA
jgi:hypothetical protein